MMFCSRRDRLLAFFIVSLTVALWGCQNPKPYFDEKTCPFQLDPSQVPGKTVRCGILYTPEQHAHPTHLIEVPVLVFKGKSSTVPVVQLSGGPGQSWADLGLNDITASQSAQFGPDVIFVEQRGTGLSIPNLSCPDELSCEVPQNENGDAAYGLCCAAYLEKKGYTLENYNTIELAGDIETMRSVLGYNQLTLVGVSYGTAWAQEVMRLYSAIVNKAILDSVLSPVTPPLGGGDVALSRGFDALFQACAGDPNCTQEFGDIGSEMDDTLASLKATPITLINGGASGPFNDGSYFSLATSLMPFTPTLVPNLIAEVYAALPSGELTLDSGSSQASSNDAAVTASLAIGQYFSVACSDNQQVTLADAQAEVAQMRASLQPFAQDSGTVEVCSVWPYLRRPAADFTFVTAPVPTLLLSGEFDPLTPPYWAQAVAKALPKSTWVEVPGVGHDVESEAPNPGEASCVNAILASFLQNPTDPNTVCLTQVTVTYAPSASPSRSMRTLVRRAKLPSFPAYQWTTADSLRRSLARLTIR